MGSRGARKEQRGHRGSAANRLLRVLRLAAYGSGILGALLVLLPRAVSGDTQPRLAGTGAGLLALMFLLFLATYVLHISRCIR